MLARYLLLEAEIWTPHLVRGDWQYLPPHGFLIEGTQIQKNNFTGPAGRPGAQDKNRLNSSKKLIL